MSCNLSAYCGPHAEYAYCDNISRGQPWLDQLTLVPHANDRIVAEIIDMKRMSWSLCSLEVVNWTISLH